MYKTEFVMGINFMDGQCPNGGKWHTFKIMDKKIMYTTSD